MIVDGQLVTCAKEFHALVAEHPKTPDYYGRNLDALDEISGGGLGPEEIVWRKFEVSKQRLGQDFSKLATVLRQYAFSEATDKNDWKVTFR